MANIFDLQATISLNAANFENGIQQAQTAFSGMGSKISAGSVALGTVVGNMATKAAGAVVDFAKDSVASGMSFEAGMSQIAATLGMTTDDIANNVNGAGDTFDALKKKAAEMGRSTNFSASQAAEGLNILAMSGFDAEQSIGMIEDVLHLAAAGSMEMGSAAGYISGAMKGFADETKDSGYYADLMAKGATLANTSVSQLGEAMSAGAAGAASYSQNAESMTVALLRLAEQSVVGSAAGTALAASMKDIYTPTDQAAKALAELGVSAYENGKALDFNDIVNNLSDALAGYSEEEANAYKQTIFGIQGLNAFNKMTVTGVETQARWADALSGASDGLGEAAKQYDTMTSNLQGAKDSLNSALEGLQNAVYEKLSGPLTEATHIATDALGEMTKGFEENGFKGAVSALGAFVKTKFQDMWSSLSLPPQFQTVIDNLKVLGDAVKFAVERFGNLKDVFAEGGIKAVFAEFGEFISNIVGVSLENMKLPECVYDFFIEIETKLTEGFDKVKSVIDGFKETFSGIGEAFSGIELPSLFGIVDAIKNLFAAFGEWREAKMTAIISGVQAFIEAFKDSSIPETLGGIAKRVVEFIGAFSEKAAGIISSIAGALSDFMDGFMKSDAITAVAGLAENIAEFLGVFVDSVAKIILDIADGVKELLDSFDAEGAGQIIGDIAAGIADFASAVMKVAGDIVSKIAEGVGKLIDAFKDSGAAESIGAFASKIAEFVKPFTAGLADIIGKVGEKIGELIGWVTDFAASAIADLPGIIDSASTAFDSLVPMFEAIWEAVQPFAQWIGEVAVASFQSLGSIIKGAWDIAVIATQSFFDLLGNLADFVTSVLAGDFESAAESIKAAWGTLKGFFAGVWESIKGIFSGVKDAFYDIGTNIIDGLKNGFKAAWDAFTSWVSGIVDLLPGAVKKILGIGSPSKVFAEIGKFTVQGMEVGWEKEFGKLEEMVDSDTASLTGTAKVGFESSALGRSSAAQINSFMAGQSSGGTMEINLVLDGDVAATALYDPLRRVAWQKGKGEPAYA